MDEAIRQIHNTAMDLSELAKLKRSREGEKIYQEYLKAAFELELYAAFKIKDNINPNDQLWRVTLLRSAGWLAFKCGYLEQAEQLVKLGLSINTDGYASSKLLDLQEKIQTTLTLKKENIQTSRHIFGYLSAADLETNQINIKELKSNDKLTLSVNESEMSQIARLFLGTRVEIEAKEDENGVVYLKDIRWAA